MGGVGGTVGRMKGEGSGRKGAARGEVGSDGVCDDGDGGVGRRRRVGGTNRPLPKWMEKLPGNRNRDRNRGRNGKGYGYGRD